MQSTIPYRTLGRTGERVSAIGLGGWHLGLQRVDEQLSFRIIRTAIDRGINFLDNGWDYNDGASETRMGKALLDGYRQKVFLMTKIDGRSYAEAMRQLDQSLERLRTDCIDLVQHHEILRYDDPHRIFDEEGANRALVDGQRAGKIRYIGFTGHKDPHIHLYMLDVAREHGFLFDTVQMPLNVMDAHYRSFGTLVLPELVKQGTGVLGMKPMANGIILRSKTASPVECLRYALNLPTSVVITGVDSMKVLDQACEVARTFCPLSDPELTALLSKTAKAAARGEFEPSRPRLSSTVLRRIRHGWGRNRSGCNISCGKPAPRGMGGCRKRRRNARGGIPASRQRATEALSRGPPNKPGQYDARDADKEAPTTEEHAGGTENGVEDRTGPGAGYDDEPERVNDTGAFRNSACETTECRWPRAGTGRLRTDPAQNSGQDVERFVRAPRCQSFQTILQGISPSSLNE
jgi:aryl-alcohol dehydrogenase-like predicted oxidoreductase